MEALKAIKIIGNQNDGRVLCFYFFQIPGNINFMRDPKLAHILVCLHDLDSGSKEMGW